MVETGGPGVEQKQRVVVVGESMYPTLRTLDYITVKPYGGEPVRKGDVVVFFSPKVNTLKVAHRVIEIGPDGILTRGDHGRETDEWVLRPEDVLGKVESTRRNHKQYRVHNGDLGRLIGNIHHSTVMTKFIVREKIYVPISPPLVRIYRFLSKSGVFRIWIPRRWKPRLMSFDKPDGVEMRLLMGKRKIGICTPVSRKWVIKKPFWLFVDEKSLPPYPLEPYNPPQNSGNNADGQ
jgi:signal peptidase I